ncbi:MAG: histidine kinase dimerization/phosphoacceptor domain -containing protein [Devosia sp.]
MSSEVRGAGWPVAVTVVGKRPGWEAADWVIAGSLALVAAIALIFTLLCVQGFSTTIEGTKTRGQAAAGTMAGLTSWVIGSNLSLARGAASAIDFDPVNAGPQTLASFDTVTASAPSPLALGIYDASGKVVTSASSPRVPRDIATADYIAAVSSGEDWTLTAQEKDAASGEAIFAVVKRLGDASGFKGVVLVAVSARVLEGFAGPLNLGTGSTVSILRDDGWVIARNPSLTAPLNISGQPSMDSINSAQNGSYLSVSPADGVTRMVSFQHVDDLGHIALASVSIDGALSGLWSAILIVSLLLAPIAIALLVGSILTARLLRRTEATSRSLTAALADNDVLFREIHHRVKNNLQSVGSLLQMQPIDKSIKLAMGQRIAAMSAVHEHIYRSNTFTRVSVKDYLHTLIENIRAGHDPKVGLVEDIDSVWVDKDAATPIGLIVNEVVSNAFKHAFGDGRDGVVTVTLKAQTDGTGLLTVTDNGVGFDPEAPAKGIGRRLITGLTTQVHGKSRFTSGPGGGAQFELTFPLAK